MDVDLKNLSDEELVKRMLPQSGLPASDREAAWEEFFSRFELTLIRAIWLTFRRHAPDIQLGLDDIQDLVQQIFVKLIHKDYRALRELKFYNEDSIRLFLFTISANITLDYLRSPLIKKRQRSEESSSTYDFTSGKIIESDS